MSLSVVMITKNEELNLAKALISVSFADEIIVLDSGSTDQTLKIAERHGARVIQSQNWPGFGPQKNRALSYATSDWILSLDADEWVTPELAKEIQSIVKSPHEKINDDSVVGYWIMRSSIFVDKTIRFGDWRGDRVIRLFKKDYGHFSSDVIHERVLLGGKAEVLDCRLGHYPVRSISDSKRKMWRYNVAAAKQILQRKHVNWFDPWLHAGWSLFRGLLLRLGFLDGARGVQLTWLNAKGTFIRYEAALRGQNSPRRLTGLRRFAAYVNLIFVDHGFLRNLYDNRFSLPGGLYRGNQPSPQRISRYIKDLNIKTVINLRGANPQHGWYRLEWEACRDLQLNHINTQVHSRGLPTRERIHELKSIIDSISGPTYIHCKSGADRAGFFSVLYRHFKLNEPIETAKEELHWRFGHFRSAKTGVLDYFFEQYLQTRRPQQSLLNWVDTSYNRDEMEKKFRPRGFMTFFVDVILRRE